MQHGKALQQLQRAAPLNGWIDDPVQYVAPTHPDAREEKEREEEEKGLRTTTTSSKTFGDGR